MGPTGSVSVDLGSETVELRFTTPAILKLERKTHKALGVHLQALTTMSVESMLDLIWAGMLHQYPKQTVDEVAHRVDLMRFGEIAAGLSKAITLALTGKEEPPEPEEGADEGN